MFLILVCILLSPITCQIILQEVPSKFETVELTVINTWDSLKLSYNRTSFQNVLIGKRLPIIKDVIIGNDNSTFDFLVNTGSYYSLIINKICDECKFASKKYQNVLKKNADLTQTFSFGKLMGYVDYVTLNFTKSNSPLNLNLFSVTNIDYINTQVDFSGFLGLGTYTNETYDVSVVKRLFNGEEANSKIIGIQLSQEKKSTGRLFIRGFPEEIQNNLTSCRQNYEQEETSQFYWSCKLDYILIGDEYDFYLAKDIKQFVIFDTLSYFHIIPYDLLEYVQKTNFNKNLNCTANPLNINQTLFRLECYDTIGPPKIKAFHIILNGWAYRMGSQSLFDNEDVLNITNTKNNTYYYRVLFSKDKKGWTIGNTFLDKFSLGFDYSDGVNSRVLIHPFNQTNRHNFSLYTGEQVIVEDGILLFTLISIGLCIFFFLFLMYLIFYLKTRKILKLYDAELQNKINFENSKTLGPEEFLNN